MTPTIRTPIYARCGDVTVEIGTLIVTGEEQGVEISREKVKLFQRVMGGGTDAAPE